MINRVWLIINGKPQGKGRPRFAKRGNFVNTYTPQKTADYENTVRAEYVKKYGNRIAFDDEQLKITVTAEYSIPKNTPKYKLDKMLTGKIRPTVKPDVDNVLKIIADALNGLAYKDDKQIVTAVVEKRYALKPMTVVVVERF